MPNNDCLNTFNPTPWTFYNNYHDNNTTSYEKDGIKNKIRQLMNLKYSERIILVISLWYKI